jgi:glyoxylate/hydroxypyruvate reductase A
MGKGRILFSAQGIDPQRWLELLSQSREVVLEPDGPDDPSIEYAVVWRHAPGVLSKLPNLKIIFSIGAGVDHVLADPDIPHVPIVRAVTDELTQLMTEYVVWRVLDHQRQGMLYREQQTRGIWNEPRQPAAGAVHVGIMGFGTLGCDAAKALLALGFKVNGWSRSPRPMAGVTAFHGADGLDAFLNATDILVSLLPLTPATRGIIDYDLLGKLNRDNPLGGAVLINAGRGQLQKDADIVRALDDGLIKEASLDVFETEPLPATSPLWFHPKVFVTPHTAVISDPSYLVPPMLAQMDAFERGEKLLNMIDPKAGY